jgi:hypothetical protein
MTRFPISSRLQPFLSERHGLGPVVGRRALLKAGGVTLGALAMTAMLSGCAEHAAESGQAMESQSSTGFFTDGTDFVD